jgi:hypothetical protein
VRHWENTDELDRISFDRYISPLQPHRGSGVRLFISRTTATFESNTFFPCPIIISDRSSLPTPILHTHRHTIFRYDSDPTLPSASGVRYCVESVGRWCFEECHDQHAKRSWRKTLWDGLRERHGYNWQLGK